MSNLILLHGAIGAADHFDGLVAGLRQDYNVHTMNFPGHGGKGMPEAYSIPLFADEVIKYMDDCALEKAAIFGYSMGGYVAMYCARQHPERIERVITLATKFHWDREVAAKEMQMLNADKIAAKVPAFAEALQKRHAPLDWKEVLQKTGDMLYGLGEANTLQLTDYIGIAVPCLVMLGDRDKMVTQEETIAVYKSLPNAQLAILPSTPHPIEQVDVALLSFFIRRFVTA